MTEPTQPPTDLTVEQVRQLAARRHQLDLEAWGASASPIPAHLPSPDEVARQVLAQAGVIAADPPTADPERIRTAVAEAESLPPYERPTTVGEMARWVKTRLYGHVPLPADRMTSFLLTFATAELRRPPDEDVNGWSKVPADSLRSTAHAAGGATTGGGSRLSGVIETLIRMDRTTGELLLLSEYAGQSPEALTALTGHAAEDVQRELAAARAWVSEELRLAANAPSAS